MIRWFKTRRALIKELREYQTAFDSLTASFERHRAATKKTADLQQQTIARLTLENDRMRLAAGAGIMRPLAQRSPMAERIASRQWPEDLIDRLRQDDAYKQRDADL